MDFEVLQDTTRSICILVN